jgi:transposase
MAKARRSFTPEFKIAAVQLVTGKGYSFAEAARSLDISENLLRKWKQTLEAQGVQAFPGHGQLPPLEEELRRLRAENKRLLMERDVLKKATAFFAAEAL